MLNEIKSAKPTVFTEKNCSSEIRKTFPHKQKLSNFIVTQLYSLEMQKEVLQDEMEQYLTETWIHKRYVKLTAKSDNGIKFTIFQHCVGGMCTTKHYCKCEKLKWVQTTI